MCFYNDDYEPCDIWNEYTRKAKKEHRCSDCRGIIKPGTIYKEIRSLFEGSFSTYKQCQGCLTVIEDIARIEIARGCKEHEARPQIGELWDAVRYGKYEAPNIMAFQIRHELAKGISLTGK